MTSSAISLPQRLLGFDSQGEVYQHEGRIFRGIYWRNGPDCRRVLEVCQTHNLFRHGIVFTREAAEHPLPPQAYELVLEHRRIPFVTYPHEWPAAMLKDSALFHLDLAQTLREYGLALKDCHPYNILFHHTRPIFVDFTSIVPAEKLKDVDYLRVRHFGPGSLVQSLWGTEAACNYEMYRRMFHPYFLVPLYWFRGRRYRLARQRFLESTLNASRTSLRLREALGLRPFWLAYLFWALARLLALAEPGPVKHRFWQALRREVSTLPVLPGRSAYSGYYVDKGEDFGFEPSPDWTEKQHGVYAALRELRATTVLDIGCNVGWFSILAAKLGSQVVACDMDEASLTLLYERARQERLPITPLSLDFTQPTPDMYATPEALAEQPDSTVEYVPLLSGAHKRLRCELVLMLALVHHLALGHGMSFPQIAERLSDFAGKYLVLEFVAREDTLIVAEPESFPTYQRQPSAFDWYSLERLEHELRRYFRSVERRPSYPPGSRTLLICAK